MVLVYPTVPRSLAPPGQWAVREGDWMVAHLQPSTSVSVENISGLVLGALPPPGTWRYSDWKLGCGRAEG